ncbi:MAG: agmatine deiminase family protein [Caulobacterales bacterium]
MSQTSSPAAFAPPPGEWAARRTLWTAWPSHEHLWGEALGQARAEVGAMVMALAMPSPATGAPQGDRVMVLAADAASAKDAEAALGRAAHVVIEPFGDIWLRDTGPIFLGKAADGAIQAAAFRFNGWGGKYQLPHDSDLAPRIAGRAGARLVQHDFVLEGGAVEGDGEGTILTTRQCVLNPNRNEGWTQGKAEAALAAALGAKKVLWLDEGLLNDHTDGHVDNIARYVAPGHVVCQAPFGADDPNIAALDAIAAALSVMTDAAGRRLKVTRIPSPGLVQDEDGEPVPASHMNFIIGTRVVVVPTYGTASADDAVAALRSVFPDRTIVGLPSNAILEGGGSFHCITQQEPELEFPQ